MVEMQEAPRISDLKHVEETILKHRRSRDEIQRTRQQELKKRHDRRKKKLKKDFVFKRPEYILRRFKQTHKQQINIRKRFKQQGKFKISDVPQTLFVIRIKDGKSCPKEIKNHLKLLKLDNFLDACFIQNNEEARDILRTVEPWITFGYPTNKIIQQLILRRGAAEPDRTPLKSNVIVEDNFAEVGLICIDDLIDVLFNGGEQFNAANGKVAVFKLGKPEDDFAELRKRFKEKGAWGNREDQINELVEEMI